MVTDEDLETYKKRSIGGSLMNLSEKQIFGTDIVWIQKLLLTVSEKAQ